MGTFAKARIEALLKKAGAQRVSSGAINRMDESLTDYQLKIA